MENPFNLSKEKLTIFMNGYISWINSNPKEKQYPEIFRKQSQSLREEFLNAETLARTSDEDLYQKVFKYSRSLEGPVYIRMGESRIKESLSKIRRDLNYIISSDDKPFFVAQSILEGELKIEIFAKSFWSPILQARFPNVLPNWNNKTDRFFKKLGVKLSTSKLTVSEKYELLSNSFLFLGSLVEGQDFFNVNHLMHYGTEIEEGKKLIQQFLIEEGIISQPKLNLKKFHDALLKYIDVCSNTNWLNVDEAYKFRFGRWLNEKVNFENQTDQEILKICRDSQNIKYDKNSTGINFLLSSKRFKDEFIEENDIKIFRELHSGTEADEEIFKNLTLTYPEVSAWLASLFPVEFKACPNTKLIDSLSWLYDKEDIPRKGYKSFAASQELLSNLTGECLKEQNRLFPIMKSKLQFEDITNVDNVWLVQDIILFISTRILSNAEIESKEKRYWLYAPGENAHMWEEFYQSGVMGLGWEDLGDLRKYQSKKEIESKLQEIYETSGSKRNDATANFDFLKGISVGDIIIVKRGRGELLGYGEVNSDYYFDDSKPHYQKFRKVLWLKKGIWKTDHDLALKTLTDITGYSSDVPGIDHYYERLLKLMNREALELPKKKQMLQVPLNTIFYGPPGTGKTYNTVLRAAQIVEEKLDISYSEAQGIFNKNLNKQIEFITFHQNYSYEDFIQGLRPDIENESELRFERKDGVFKRIADRALKNLIESERPSNSKREFPEVFSEFIASLSNEETEEIEVPMKKVSFFINDISSKSIDFRKNSGESKHSLSIETLRKMYDKGANNLIIGGLQPYYNSILAVLLEKGRSNVAIIPKKNFVIVIDEINRANISRVFGELITLIECDKRSHGSFPLKCTLPSGDEFIVPSNLYIIGTMNTADKSIALLDIALRRRFDFEPMYPLYKIQDHMIYDSEILKKINEKIRKLKGCDFQIGHAYFMDKNISLTERMNKKVIPLLLEYFMNDEIEVKGILTNAGLVVEPDSWPLKIHVQQ